MQKDYTNKEYEAFSEAKSKKSPTIKNVFFAFLVGGAICTLGEVIKNFAMNKGMPQDVASTITSISLIFLSVLFTGLDLYDDLAKHAGAGTLVPITGFANAIASPAIEFKSEGYILGVAAKMFVVAGPVIVYGLITSVAAGVIYFLLM